MKKGLVTHLLKGGESEREMPKISKKPRRKGGKGARIKKGGKVAPVRKAKHVDIRAPKDKETSIRALVEEIELQEESPGQQSLPKARKKKRRNHRLKEIDGLKIKPGMTLAQAQSIAEKLRQQRLLQNIPDRSFEDDEKSEEEAEECQGGADSGEDYSDTANERPTEYRKGGYHPVVVGEVYHDRYRIVKKLGWGYFSTVWLVWDHTRETYQAMKVQKSAKHYTEAAYDEIKLLGEIMTADANKTFCCARLNDHFEQSGPNGVHVCMVFDVYGEDLLSLIDRYEYRGVPLPIVKSIARQVLMGLEHVHSLDIIHTDLKPENVLLSTPKHSIISLMKHYSPPPLHQRLRLVERDPKTMTKSQRRRYYKKLKLVGQNGASNGNFEGKDTHTAASKPSEGSSNTLIGENNQENAESDTETDPDWEIERLQRVVLADFGNSCWTYCQFTDEVQTRQYRCPEVILGEPYSTPIDLWSAACLFFELITGEFLFNPGKGENYSRDEDHLALMTELLGELPAKMRLGDGKYRSQYYNSRGELRHIKDLNFWSLDDVLYRKHKFTRKKAEEIADFLLPMLEFDPRKRATASEMLINFEHFFAVQEDDYAPLCFVSSDAEQETVVSSTGDDEGDYEEYEEGSEKMGHCAADVFFERRKENSDGGEDKEIVQFLNEHPVLKKDFLEKRGLTVLDIQTVLLGKRLESATLQEAAMEVIRLLSEGTDADRGEDVVSRGTEYSGDVSSAGD